MSGVLRSVLFAKVAAADDFARGFETHFGRLPTRRLWNYQFHRRTEVADDP